MGYVVVKFSEDRDVIVDDGHSGQTNGTILVADGVHDIELGGDKDYAPPSWNGVVADSTVLEPMIITFTKIAVSGDV